MSLDLNKSTDLLHYTKEDVKKVLVKYDRTEESIITDVNIVKEWLQTQPHLPDHPSDRQIVSFLIKNKFYMKKVQEKIDMNYTIKTLVPEFYKDFYPSCARVTELIKDMQWIVLPNLSKGSERIYIYRHIFDETENINMYDMFSLVLLHFELNMLYDISDGIVIIIDAYKTIPSSMIKCTPMLLRKMMTVLEKVYSNRIYAIHFLNIPSYLVAAFNLVISMFSSKLKDRCYFHSDYKLLLDLYRKEVIPIEYGGTEKSCDELHKNSMDFLKEHDGYFRKINNQHVNENLRQEKLMDDELLGYYGHFRKIDLD